MSYPRTTDVAKHLERKFRNTGNSRTKVIPISDAAAPDLKAPSERPVAAVRSAQSPPKPINSR